MGICEPCQGRNAAALSKTSRVPRGSLGRANCKGNVCGKCSKQGARINNIKVVLGIPDHDKGVVTDVNGIFFNYRKPRLLYIKNALKKRAYNAHSGAGLEKVVNSTYIDKIKLSERL